jgi:hypothetical protein
MYSLTMNKNLLLTFTISVEPSSILIQIALPALAQDCRNQIASIIETKSSENEINVQDGFELYKEMVEIRRWHFKTFPPE